MKTRKRSLIKFLTVPLIFILLGFVSYKYGYKIPVLKEIPFFATGHDHQLMPVLGMEGEIDYWTCSMHPSVKLKEQGKCPICGMDTIPVKKRDSSQTEQKNMQMDEMKMNDKEMKSSGEMQDMKEMDESMHGMDGMNKPKEESSKSTFTVSPERQQRIGVKTEEVKVRPMTKKIRTVGMVELDETKIEHIHTKFNGWIEEVFVDYTFQHVKKGEPLFSIYSPELVSTQEEYLLALRSKKILGDSQFSEISEGSNSLVEATRRRLKLWDISEGQIKELEKTGKVKTSLVIHSPLTGHVTFKNAFNNMYVEPNTRIYTIADHASVWVNADIYENDISLVKEGQQATMTVESLPGELFEGKVTFMWPHLMAETRTTKARLEFPNPDLKLLPGMYTNVNINIPLKTTLTVPESAVLQTGKQNVVFVDKGNGNMEIRKVELGHEAEGYYEVLRGLNEGDMVVSRANFLIDAESRIQAAVASWNDSSDKDTMDMEQ
ncbi:MAG: efflux RND transporter periplasmic adaptor subunit [Thermodesulfobacteriota bacterium]